MSAFTFIQLAATLRLVHAIEVRGLGGTTDPEVALIIINAAQSYSLLAVFLMLELGFFWLGVGVLTCVDLLVRGGFLFTLYVTAGLYVLPKH